LTAGGRMAGLSLTLSC